MWAYLFTANMSPGHALRPFSSLAIRLTGTCYMNLNDKTRCHILVPNELKNQTPLVHSRPSASNFMISSCTNFWLRSWVPWAINFCRGFCFKEKVEKHCRIVLLPNWTAYLLHNDTQYSKTVGKSDRTWHLRNMMVHLSTPILTLSSSVHNITDSQMPVWCQ